MIKLPEKFEFVLLSGPGGSSYALRLKEGKLEYVETPPDFHSSLFGASSDSFHSRKEESKTCSPEETQWSEFSKGMEDQDVYGWRHHYDDSAVMHGVQWSLHIIWGEKEARSGGSNAFPGQEEWGKMGYTPQFQEFLKLIRNLSSQDVFGGY